MSKCTRCHLGKMRGIGGMFIECPYCNGKGVIDDVVAPIVVKEEQPVVEKKRGAKAGTKRAKVKLESPIPPSELF